jgi:hypothetical protein
VPSETGVSGYFDYMEWARRVPSNVNGKKIQNAVWLVYFELVRRINVERRDGGQVWPSHAEIREACCLSQETLCKAIATLIGAGLITASASVVTSHPKHRSLATPARHTQ